jgi:hypothetical protein
MSRLRPTMRLMLRTALAAALVVCVASAAWACPTCKEDLANNPQGQGLAAGFYYSILFMMSMPFLIIGTLGTVAYRSVKRAQAEREAAAAATDA